MYGVEADDACRPVQEKLGSYVRGALAARETRRVKRHLDGCKHCKAFHAELACVNSALRDVLGPRPPRAGTRRVRRKTWRLTRPDPPARDTALREGARPSQGRHRTA
ncbi:zf-HC2 domain-containing protein [Actinomadura madurae]|uniref:zf-HC2 domain-containing protein n=1 Tax=Actinomadura madurae TaxID=1993 RepID=UPI003D6A4AFF